jgi:hypothetical protein
MKATDVLQQQQRDIETLLGAVERATDTLSRIEIFEELASTLVAHDAIERELFYPACAAAIGKAKWFDQTLAEHAAIELRLHEADQAHSKRDFEHKYRVLKAMVAHRIAEAAEVLARAELAIEDEELERLGQRMERRFEVVRDADFRTLLRRDLHKKSA